VVSLISAPSRIHEVVRTQAIAGEPMIPVRLLVTAFWWSHILCGAGHHLKNAAHPV
jgi:hypothetical protein